MNDQEEENTSLKRYLIKTAPLAAAFTSVAFGFIALLSELFGESREPTAWRTYAGGAGVSILLFFLALLYVFVYENKANRVFLYRALSEENHFDIQEQGGGKNKITCEQNLVVEALNENRVAFRLFNPLEGFIPVRFEFPDGQPKELDQKELKNNPEGVSVFFPNRKFLKNIPEEITAIWTYEYAAEGLDSIVASVHRPTAILDLCITFPTSKERPRKHGWEIHNPERFPVQGGSTVCHEHSGRCSLNKRFKRVKEGFNYVVWWEY